eukprot:7915590-Lingulodinium_polyedra.AAC.1
MEVARAGLLIELVGGVRLLGLNVVRWFDLALALALSTRTATGAVRSRGRGRWRGFHEGRRSAGFQCIPPLLDYLFL